MIIHVMYFYEHLYNKIQKYKCRRKLQDNYCLCKKFLVDSFLHSCKVKSVKILDKNRNDLEAVKAI